jgi:hypothetical protein
MEGRRPYPPNSRKSHFFRTITGLTHLALDKDASGARPVERAEEGRIMQIPQVGGLHHRYVRRAA